MNLKLMAAVAAFLTIALATPLHAKERKNKVDHFCGERYCSTYADVSTFKHSGAGNCPRNLGCGCNLANYFHIAGRAWRELWVARNWLGVGHRASHGCVGCVAVLSRGRGGHVGVVRGYEHGNPVIYSYANGRLGWTTATYPSRRVLGYRSI